MVPLAWANSSSPCMSGVQRLEPSEASFCKTTTVHTRQRSKNRTYRSSVDSSSLGSSTLQSRSCLLWIKKQTNNNNNNNNNNPDLNRRCSWQDGNFSRSGTSHKPSFQSSMLYLSRTIKMLFISGWGGWNIVWLVQNCTDFRELVGVVDWPFDRVNDWITDLSLSLCPSPHACACVWIWLSVCLSLCLSLILLW